MGSVVATLSTAVIFLPEIHWSLSLLLRIFISAGVTFSAFGFENVAKFFSRLFGFYSVSFGYAGIIFGLWLLFKPQGVLVNNGAVYIDVSPFVLLCSFCVGYFILRLLRKYFGVDIKNGEIFKMVVFTDRKTVEFSVLLDTGNRLRDPLSDLPVAVVDYDAAADILPLSLAPVFAGKTHQIPSVEEGVNEGFRVIPYSVIGGEGLLPAFKPKRVEIWKNHKKISEKECIISISREKFNDGIDGIIGEDFVNI